MNKKLIIKIAAVFAISFVLTSFLAAYKYTEALLKSTAANTHVSAMLKINENHINYFSKMNQVLPYHNQEGMRKFPYPYRSMLSITSDIDGSTPEEFTMYHQFLNTKEETAHGIGIGLDVGDSMWIFMDGSEHTIADLSGHGLDYVMTFFEGINDTKKKDANLITYYFKKGWIDSIHTFGDFSRNDVKDVTFRRSFAVKAWDVMKKAGIDPIVWIDHGNSANVQNFGAYAPWGFSKYQEGDNPASDYYHTDLTIKNGIRFVWNSVGKPAFGYDNPLYIITLRDKQKVWGFYRYTQDMVNNKTVWTWNPLFLYKQITKERLNTLVEKQQYSLIAQHLGGCDIGFPFRSMDIQALRLLASYQDEGKILIARTSRLLTYAVSQQYVKFDVTKTHGKTYINIKSINDPIFGSYKPTLDQIRGLTFYTNNPNNAYILLNSKPIKDTEIQRNPKDETGNESIGIKWYKPDYTDYTKTAPTLPVLIHSIRHHSLLR